jgi:hypothetical protein
VFKSHFLPSFFVPLSLGQGDRFPLQSKYELTNAHAVYVTIAKAYVEAINSGVLPNIATALDSAIVAEATEAFEAAIKVCVCMCVV